MSPNTAQQNKAQQNKQKAQGNEQTKDLHGPGLFCFLEYLRVKRSI